MRILGALCVLMCVSRASAQCNAQCGEWWYNREVSGGIMTTVSSCPPGTYCSGCCPGYLGGCPQCPANTYSGIGACACTACAAGKTSTAGASVCVSPPCPVGTYKSGENCIVCPAGSYSTVSGATVCTNCLAGTYSNVTGASSANVCTNCQANATSAAGSVSQEYCYCKSGYAHVAGSYTCRICDPGTYNSQLGRMACSNCSVGLYSVNYGATGNETCLRCPLGQWSPEGSPSCNLCPANSGAAPSSGSLSNCACDAGYTGPNGGQCSACAAGQYKNVTGASACVSCPAGKYSGVTGASNCTTCPSNFTSLSGSSSVSACVCGNNLYEENLQVQIDCANCQVAGTPRWGMSSVLNGALDGTWNNQAQIDKPNGISYWRVDLGSSKFIAKFDIRFYTASLDGLRVQVGNIDAVDANPSCATIAGDMIATITQYNVPCTQTGRFLFVRVDANSCRCADGWNCGICSTFYLNEVRMFSQTTQCSSCPQFSTSEFASKSISDCKCKAGAYLSGSLCVNCSAGTYSNLTGATNASACVLCPAGSYSGVTGASSANMCLLCPVGLYSIAGASVCTCAVGMVSVNSVCTYNDPALKYWYKFEASDPKKNWGSGSGGVLRINGDNGGNLPLVLSSRAKQGTSSLASEIISGPSISEMQDVNKYSISFWLFFHSDYISYNSQFLIYQGWATGLQMALRSSDTQFGFRHGPDYNYVEFDSAVQYRNQWVHITATIDYGTRNIYVNGILKYSFVYSPYTSDWRYIGLNLFTGNVMNFDDFRIYSRILTAQEAMWLYKPCEVDAPFYFDTYVCPCNYGYTGPTGGPCVACEKGKYRAAGSANCTNCVAGTYANADGASSCTNCTAGSYSGVAGASSVSVCLKCPAGKYSGAAGASNASACVSCPAGMISLEGASACICPANTYEITDVLGNILATSPAYFMTSAEAWDAANSRFTDLSGNGRHGALTQGTVTLGSVTANGAGWSIPFVGGTTATRIAWPSGSIAATFTICSITRYTGGANQRILGAGAGWLHGHHSGKAGSTYYPEGNLGYSISTVTNWVIQCGRNIGTAGAVSTIVNGVVTGTALGGGKGSGQLTINEAWGENSNWQLSRLYVWNTHLSNADFAEASEKLNSYIAAGQTRCSACLASTYSPSASTAKEQCVCNAGYSGPGGSSVTYVPEKTYTDLTSSCGVNANQKCTCVSSDTLPGRQCNNAFDDDKFNTYYTARASVCIEANICSYGQSSVRPYIRIDFGQKVSVTSVKIYVRWDGWSPRNFNIFVGDSTTIENNNLCATGGTYPDTAVERTFTCGDVLYGTYVFIQQGVHDGNYMQIAEMEVVGSTPEKNPPCPACAAGSFKNVSGGAACTNCSRALYSLSGATTCLNCTDGYFVQFPNAPSKCLFNLTCSACPGNTYHANGTCVACPVNTSSANGSVACQCKAGVTGVAVS